MSSPLETPRSALGKAIRFIRQNAKLTQRQVADKSGIHLTQISDLERGKVNPTHRTIKRLAKGLGVPCSQIFTLEEVFARGESC